ncbi:energy transducer TonB [Marinobacter sp. BW6]|uniref:energy transducer TonB family protein n=1 Tax=Marinobacter sp. BW6 TaxID=2592624 RepID=UPI001F07D79F|nr:energy transducer TonB [Marinobacter sp. BW6]
MQSSENPEQSITRITESPAELDPYVVKLATHLAHQLEELKVPAMRDLTETVAMEVELQLLGNGALTRARVLKSTGIRRIDEAAYRAALAASPYPQPPKDGGSPNRFEVELLFTPKRL